VHCHAQDNSSSVFKEQQSVGVIIGFDSVEAAQFLTARDNENTALGISNAI